MKNLSDYPQYRRVFPKLRLSWSLYLKWKRNDWEGIAEYLRGEYSEPTFAMSRGKEIHKRIENNIDPILQKLKCKKEDLIFLEDKFVLETKHDYNIVAIPDAAVGEFIIDFKTGNINGYDDQIHLYNYVLNRMAEDSNLYIEDDNGYSIWVREHNFKAGLLIKIDDELEIVRKKMVVLSVKESMEIGHKFQLMYDDILVQIQNNLLK